MASPTFNHTLGNRLSRGITGLSLPAQTFTFDANDRLNTDTYDANGNTLLGSGFGQSGNDEYDFENRLVTRHTSSATVQITYDGDGNRVSKTLTTSTNSVTTYYVVDELNPSGYAQVLEEHVSLNSQPSTLNCLYTYGHTLISQQRLSTLSSQSSTNFYGYDGHNNVRYLTDANGNVTDTYDYDAFGNLIARTGTTVNNYLFTGEQYDADLGLYYLRARYQNTDTGRFWTQDSFEGDNTDPSSLHKYTYCSDHPINAYDPSGNETVAEIGLTSGMFGVARALFGATVGGMSGSIAGGYDAILHGQLDDRSIAQAMTDGFKQGAWGGGILGFAGGFGNIGQFGVSAVGLVYSGAGFLTAYQSYLNGNEAAGNFEAGIATVGAVFSSAGLAKALTEAYTGAGIEESITSQAGERLGLKPTGANEYTSTRSGLRYGPDPDPSIGNRVNHVLAHTADILAKNKQGVFDAKGSAALTVVDDAWMKLRLAGFKDSTDVRVTPQGGRIKYVVNMRQRVGFFGGAAGAAAGNPALNAVTIVVESDGVSVVTAFPDNF